MGLFDSITDSLNRGSAAVGRATRSTQLKMQMNDLLKQRQGLAGQLGASLYEATKDNPSLRAGREAIYDGIAQIDAQRDAIQQQLNEIEAEAGAAVEAATIYKCPDCGSDVYATDMFCTGCGKPVADIRAMLETPTAPPVVESGLACPNCGAPIKEDDVFCMSCGNRIELAAQEAVQEEVAAEADEMPAEVAAEVPVEAPADVPAEAGDIADAAE